MVGAPDPASAVAERPRLVVAEHASIPHGVVRAIVAEAGCCGRAAAAWPRVERDDDREADTKHARSINESSRGDAVVRHVVFKCKPVDAASVRCHWHKSVAEECPTPPSNTNHDANAVDHDEEHDEKLYPGSNATSHVGDACDHLGGVNAAATVVEEEDQRDDRSRDQAHARDHHHLVQPEQAPDAPARTPPCVFCVPLRKRHVQYEQRPEHERQQRE
mmetsp:Transcript_8359/g.29711  ORF Transcript_8359/g.29711 Transcript_8359/m.29711 type:complete len:218 (+) Transcript_8359:1093-1746(+)